MGCHLLVGIAIQHIALGRRIKGEAHRAISTATQHTKATQSTHPTMFEAIVHLKDKAVDKRSGIQLRHTLALEQATQAAVVVFDKVGEQDSLRGHLDDERTQIRHHQTLVRRQIFCNNFYYHCNKSNLV